MTIQLIQMIKLNMQMKSIWNWNAKAVWKNPHWLQSVRFNLDKQQLMYRKIPLISPPAYKPSWL